MMNTFIKAAAGTAFLLSSSTAFAAGLDRTSQSVLSVLEEGDFLQIGLGYAVPSVSGTIYGSQADDVSGSFISPSLISKFDMGDNFAVAIIYDQPFGATLKYPDDLDPLPVGIDNPANGAEVNLLVDAVTVVGHLKVNELVSLFGGPRIILAEGEYTNPSLGLGDYEFRPGSTTGAGVVAGAAFYKPEIGLGLAVTYSSAVKLDFPAFEKINGDVANRSGIEVTVPQSVNVDFRTGINEKTLLMAGMRWVNWQEFELTPTIYGQTFGEPLVDYYEDSNSYYVGAGYKVNDDLSLTGRISFEEPMEGDFSALGPTDGATTLSGAAVYKMGEYEFLGGLSYTMLGDDSGEAEGFLPASDFSGNSGIGFGLSVKRYF